MHAAARCAAAAESAKVYSSDLLIVDRKLPARLRIQIGLAWGIQSGSSAWGLDPESTTRRADCTPARPRKTARRTARGAGKCCGAPRIPIPRHQSPPDSCRARRILVGFCSAPGSACAPAKWDSVIPQQLRVEPGAAPLLNFSRNVTADAIRRRLEPLRRDGRWSPGHYTLGR